MIEKSTLGEVGNASAPPGSREWAVAVRLDIQGTLNDINGDARHLRVMVGLIREHKGYRQLLTRRGQPFATFEGFCSTPQPFGLGYDRDNIETIIAERAERSARERAEKATPLLAQGRPPKPTETPEQPTENKGSNTTFPVGRASDYLTARIARDRPDVLERMKAGEFPSVRAAALEAGIVKRSITLPLDVDRAARLIVKHFAPEDVRRLCDELTPTPSDGIPR